jgi:hypothetical protein
MTTQIQLINSGGQATFEGFVTPGPLYVRALAFDFTTAGVTAGVPVVQLRAGDVIYDLGFAIPTAFNGTTPFADFGTFSGGNAGIFTELAGAAVDLTAADTAVTDNAGLSSATTRTWLSAAIGSVGAAAGAAFLPAPLQVTADSELFLVVSQSGQKGGTATGATAGAAVAYVVTSTPG